MFLQTLITRDGSHTISIPETGLTYHSHHGAIQESVHVFIDAGLKEIQKIKGKEIKIFEMGFGTGLNALLTLIEAEKNNLAIHYTAIDLHPLEQEIAATLNYPSQTGPAHDEKFMNLHTCAWEEEVPITPSFHLHKIKTSLIEFESPKKFDLIYYDAFAPSAQPELWTVEIFRKLFEMMNDHAILVTYCSKSDVRRAMIAAGLQVEKIPGPRGKREMLRAKV